MPTGNPYFDRPPDADGMLRLGSSLRDAAVDPLPVITCRRPTLASPVLRATRT
ncbi:MAG TPA: hypothetical protein VFI46_11705 [Jiangellaceae bacterium]|nr:hypothetical protein [Jiangellaceae bacterium]